MKAACFRLVMLLLAIFAMPAAAQVTHIQPRIVSEVATPAAGQTITLAVEMRTDKGWHGYWSNPGEAGFGPTFGWTLPKGAALGTPRFPVPHTLSIAGLMNYVFEADHALLFQFKVPKGLATGTPLPIRANADWLACTDAVCVPERGSFAIDLKVGDGAITDAARFDVWRAALPTSLGAKARFTRTGDRLRLAIPYPADAEIRTPHFFPAEKGLILDAAPQLFSRDGDALIVSLAAAEDGAPVMPAGLLSIGGRGLEVTAEPGAVPPDGVPLGGSALSASSLTAILLAIGGAVLGGLILNIMPCVFPILSLKALGLAKAGGSERAARRDALGYTLGSVLVCVGLGAAILVLRAGGSSVGWAFQLQNPAVIIALLVLVVAIALNLAGLFALPSVGGGLASGNSVMTGALAAFIATPCTGPFMGVALGAALVLPPVAAMAVFTGLGFGLALPFLLLGFVPALRKRLPKPGPWMATLRRILSVPMFLTALALLWVLGRQAGSDAVVLALATSLITGLAFWLVGLRQAHGKGGLLAGSLFAISAVALTISVLPVSNAPATASADLLKSEPFSEGRLAALRQEGRPVFVYFTADWCLTCKVNERAAISRPQVVAAFEKAKVATLIGDWTRSDPAIGRFLNAQGRSGVPLYLYYRPGAANPEILPQVLTPGTLVALTS